MWKIIAVVSAEKIMNIVGECVAQLNEIIGLAIWDYYDDAKVREFVASSMHKGDVRTLLKNYNSWILDNGAMDVVLYSVDEQFQLTVDRWKTLCFSVGEPVAIVDLLLDCGIPGKKEMPIYQEKQSLLFREPNYVEILEEVLARINIEHIEEFEY